MWWAEELVTLGGNRRCSPHHAAACLPNKPALKHQSLCRQFAAFGDEEEAAAGLALRPPMRPAGQLAKGGLGRKRSRREAACD